MGDGGIFVQKDIKFSNTEIAEFCKVQHIEACAIKKKSSLSSIRIIGIYRAPLGNFELFIEVLENVIQKIYKICLIIITCGDINTS
jgi:hypothetical protein